ncbi:MAG: hypothetical protein M1828_005105 [Chrysothrix sp. TS-e1954]|nr:MAG: hypothetical protein M1828_005105 [Chrysothrix sp. TS-e1954]
MLLKARSTPLAKRFLQRRRHNCHRAWLFDHVRIRFQLCTFQWIKVGHASSVVSPNTAHPVDLAWRNAQRRTREHYTPDQLAIVASAKSAEDVLQHLSLLQAKAAKGGVVRFYGKIRPFLDSVAQYDEVLKIYSNSHMAVAILWGSIDLLLVVLNDLGDNLPRMQQCVDLFSDSTRLCEMLAAVYADVMDFCILATTLFCRKSFLLLKKIIWSDFEAQSSRIIASLEKHKNLVDLEANSCHVEESKAARRQQKSHNELLECLEVVKWLNPADAEDQFVRLQQIRVEGTGQWFFTRSEVKCWLDESQQLMWVVGIPGCGKSMISSTLVTHMKARETAALVACFFCDAGEPAKRTSVAILRSLIAQLVAGNADLVRLTREIIIKSGQEKATSFSKLSELFKLIVSNCSQSIYIVIDALDECEDGRDSDLLGLLLELTANHRFHVAVFSRNEPWLRTALSTWPSIEITSQMIEQDMTLYIQKAVQRPPLSKVPDNNLGHRITQTLIDKADGQFLWTRLMVESLEKATFISEINQILSDVPRGLGRLYDRVLEKLLAEHHRRQTAIKLLLKWLSCAERHLTMTELATALSVRPGAAAIDADDRVLDLTAFLEDVCGALIKISEPSGDRGECVVSFVHLTVKEYLLASDDSRSSPPPSSVAKFHVAKSEANQHLASICITYLSLDDFKDKSKRNTTQQAPIGSSGGFLDYAAMFWVRHLTQSGSPTIDLLRRLHLFLKSDQLLTYIERSVAVNNAGFSMSNLLVSQRLLNEWIGHCDPQDPRLALVADCFRLRLEESVRRSGEDLGAEHPETVEAKFQLAELLHYRGQWARSAALHREVLDIREQMLGKQDRTTLSSMFQLASVLTRLGKHDESRHVHEEALQGRRALLGANAPDTLSSEDGLAKTLKEQGLLSEAEALSRATLIRKTRAFGETSLEAALTMDNLASTLKDIGIRNNARHDELLASQAFWESEAISRQGLAIREARLRGDG